MNKITPCFFEDINIQKFTIARNNFISNKRYVNHMFKVGNFSPEEVAKFARINKYFHDIICGQTLNYYWHGQYVAHEYPLFFLNKDILLTQSLEGNPETIWYEQFSKQKWREVDEKNFYRIMLGFTSTENKNEKKKIEEIEEKETKIDLKKEKLRSLYDSKTSILIEFTKDLINNSWKNSLIGAEIVANQVEEQKQIDYLRSTIKLEPLICNYNKTEEILKKHHINILFDRSSCSYEFKFAQRFFRNFDEKNMDYLFSLLYFDNDYDCDKELDFLLDKKCSRTIDFKINQIIDNEEYENALIFIDKYKNDDKIGILNYTLGMMYCEPANYDNVVQENFKKAFEEINIAVSKKYPPAGFILGKLYLRGLGVDKDENKGMEIIKTHADKGCLLSQKFMAESLAQGKYTLSQNLDQAFKYLIFAANWNDAEAIYSLGNAYERGIGCERNIGEAIKNFELAGRLGYADALYRLAILYHEGKDVEHNFEKAIEYYKKASYYDHQRAILTASFFIIRENGFSHFENQKIPCTFFEPLINNIGNELIKVEIDFYNKLMDLEKCQDPLIICGLVDILFTFEQGKKITEVMVQELNKALTLLNNHEIANLHYHLGLCYFRGFGTPVNIQLAKENMAKARELKHEKASVLYQKILNREKRKRKRMD